MDYSATLTDLQVRIDGLLQGANYARYELAAMAHEVGVKLPDPRVVAAEVPAKTAPIAPAVPSFTATASPAAPAAPVAPVAPVAPAPAPAAKPAPAVSAAALAAAPVGVTPAPTK